MSEQMRTQIRGLGKAKRNAQDGQAALQIAEGALGEITNMMQRQKELAVQSANDTLTSTERMYLNDEFQALTKEVNRIANNTDYNGKNVLLFDVDPNKSFAATKLNPYTKAVAFQEAANVVYKYFGQDLKGGFAALVTYTANGKVLADAITALNKTIQTYASSGILTEDNIQAVLKGFKDAAAAAGLGNDLLHTNTVSYMAKAGLSDGSTPGVGNERTASNIKTLQSVNDFLRSVEDALTNFKASTAGESDAKAGARSAVVDIYAHIGASDVTGVSGYASTTISSLDRIINQIKSAAGDLDKLGAIFGSKASAQMQDDLKAVLEIDPSKMNTGTTKDQVAAWQKTITDLKDAYKNYAEADIAVGTAASEVLHVGPNYSSGLGGATSNQIHVNYTAVDVKGLGLQAQEIDTREGAQKAIDKLQETIKVISGNRAAIGTYINRLDYTVNNIASMEYNIQDAESRIRDTDFATETTNFTRNQIMVQAATSMLAQANSLPQSVLGLIG